MKQFIWLYVWAMRMVNKRGYDFDIALICASEAMDHSDMEWLTIDPESDADEQWFDASYTEY